LSFKVKDIALAPEGRRMIEWAERHMPVLASIRQRFSEEKPLKGFNIGVALHLEAKTAVLMRTLVEGGANVAVTSCNPLTTRDEVAAALASEGLKVFAWRGETTKEYYDNLNLVLGSEPQILIDDGADLIFLTHTKRQDLIGRILGACEETTTGVNRLRAMFEEGKLRFPVLAVNDSPAKRLFDNRFGTAESTFQALMSITNTMIAGKNVVVVGYGFVGRGIASRAKGLGAIVTVVESDAIRALEAAMDGFRVARMEDAAKIGDIFITATGNINVIRKEHMRHMRDGAILCNAGHFNVEVDLKGLSELSVKREEVLADVEEFQLEDGRRLYLLAEGRLVNLAGKRSLGHPMEIMDMSFGLQALGVEYIAKHAGKLESRVYDVPKEIDGEVAKLKLRSLGIQLEELTDEQLKYLKSWWGGT
jgi:adenosylhomocysteinase